MTNAEKNDQDMSIQNNQRDASSKKTENPPQKTSYNKGNFANDPQRASLLGSKGGKSRKSHKRIQEKDPVFA